MMGAYDNKLKQQIQESITNVYKRSLDEMEKLLTAIEATIGLLPPIQTGEYEAEFHRLNQYFKKVRSSILGVGNDEIRKLNGLLDYMDVKKKPEFEDVILFN